MVPVMLSAAMLTVLAGAPRGDDKPSKPQGPAPRPSQAKMVNGSLILQERVSRRVPQTRTTTVLVNGRNVTKTITVFVPVVQVIQRMADIKAVQVFDNNGNKIDVKALGDLLKQETPVLISADGKKVDPFYLKDVKKGGLVLVFPVAQEKPKAK